MNNSIAKYAPKTKTHSMTISLTNRVMIAIGVSNLGAESYWKRIYSRLVIPMSPKTTSFLQNHDKYRSYQSTYVKKAEVKKHRMNIQNQKINDLMEKQKIDERAGKTYGASVALEVNLIHRVMIAIGVSNLGAESYWKRIYSRLVIPMSPKTTSFLQNHDKYRSYQSTYVKKAEVKKHRMNIQNQKINDLMEKQKIDERAGKTYGASVALEVNLIPDWMKRA